MSVLVTGATGLLGGTLTRRLVADGRSVRVFVRSNSPAVMLDGLDGRVERVVGDLSDPASIDEAVRGIERVYHCAAVVGLESDRSSRAMMEVNVRGTGRLVDAALHAGVTRLVHVSSVAALGRTGAPGQPVDEDAAWTESRSTTAYGRSKYLAELEVQRAVAEGLDAVIVNPALIFGPGRPGQNTSRIAEAVRDGLLRGYPAGSATVVDVDDVVDGMIAAMEKGRAGRRYILAGEILPWKAILQTLARAYGTTIPDRKLPLGVTWTAGVVAEAVAFVTRSEPRLTRTGARLAAADRHFDASRARDELDWTARPFTETAARVATGRLPT